MRRRQFFGLAGALAAAGVLAPRAARLVHAAADRPTWWQPQNFDKGVVLEWRYLAGRVTAGSEDYGFVCSLVDYKAVPGQQTRRMELIVMRQDFVGAREHRTLTYEGTLAYDAATATYSFTSTSTPAVTASWRLDSANGPYSFSVSSPELTLSELVLAPLGPLIAEGGDGDITSGNISVRGVPVIAYSDYYADWVELRAAGQPVGVARLDMQTIRPRLGGSGSGGFSHHWFALAGTLANGKPIWLSAWRIDSGGSSVWDLTVATGSSAANTWAVQSFTDETAGVTQPLTVGILEWQLQPSSGSAVRRTGQRWRLSLGSASVGDQLDLVLAVPAGQFIKSTRVGSTSSEPMQEAIGTQASGLIGGVALQSVSFAIGESTFSELGEPPALSERVFLPMLRA